MKDTIVVHHSLTRDSGTVSWQAIRRHHVGMGWRDIGYHFGIELVGDRQEILIGRMPHEVGAHCREAGMNSRGIGICLVGNFDLAPPPSDQLAALENLCEALMRIFPISVERVIGHREAGLMAGFNWEAGQYKSCPGRLFDMDALRRSLRK